MTVRSLKPTEIMRVTAYGNVLDIDLEHENYFVKNNEESIFKINNGNSSERDDTIVRNGIILHPGSKTFGAYSKGSDRYRYICPNNNGNGGDVYFDEGKNCIVIQ